MNTYNRFRSHLTESVRPYDYTRIDRPDPLYVIHIDMPSYGQVDDHFGWNEGFICLDTLEQFEAIMDPSIFDFGDNFILCEGAYLDGFVPTVFRKAEAERCMEQLDDLIMSLDFTDSTTDPDVIFDNYVLKLVPFDAYVKKYCNC